MSQFKLVSVHALGRGALWHNVGTGYHHAVARSCAEEYFVRVFWHFMRGTRAVLVRSSAIGTDWRPVWGRAETVREGESFLLSCHLLYYQDGVLCLTTYYCAQSAEARASRAAGSGLHNFLWAFHACLGDVGVS